MLPVTTCTTTLPRDPALYVRDHATFLREAFGETAEFHHTKHIPRHFEHYAAAKYGYARRTSMRTRRLSYQAWKDRLGLPPLVRTGATRAVVISMRTITKTQKGAKLFMSLPFSKTGRMRLGDNGRLSVRQQEVLKRIAEVEAIAADEKRTLATVLRDDYVRRANEPGVKRRIRMGKQ